MRVGDLLPGDPMFGIRGLGSFTDAVLPFRVRQRSGELGQQWLTASAKATIAKARENAGSSTGGGGGISDVVKQVPTGIKVGVLAIGVVGGLALMKLLASRGVF